MAIMQQITTQRKVYYQKSTTNKSFLDVHYYLKSVGIQNNKFMLILFDPDLAGIDPYDPRLNLLMKKKVLREVKDNYFYFIREVVRIPDQGGRPVQYKLSRGNLALSFCMSLNLNTFLELPRQQGKTVSAICRYLWLYSFATNNSEMAFLNKKMDDSKFNLATFRAIKDLLPPYLQTDKPFDNTGKQIKAPNTVETVHHPINHNKIRAIPSARNKIAAASLLRGRSIPLLWADEYAFIPYNKTIYLNTVPAFKTASNNAKANGAPYGMLITTTPGFLTDDEGIEAFKMKESATAFNELWYDMSMDSLQTLLNANTNSNFVYIRYNYQQLGRSEEWFKEACIDMRNEWADIRREILLEWSDSAENSPFRKEDLETIAQLVRQPIRQVLFLGKYLFNIYEELNYRYPPLIGVDVSGGFNRDSSSVVVVDSYSTRVAADFNCNYISPIDLAALIYDLVSKFMPNAVVNVERNGGYGSSVLAKLTKSSIKKNLYYEIKDKIIEERSEGIRSIKHSKRTKIFGLDSTKSIRDLLIEILRERVEYHKDKIISPTILDELKGLEISRSGRVDHGINTHDDTIFGWLMALYIYYEGKDVMNTWGIQKVALKTDEDIDESINEISEESTNIVESSEIDEIEDVAEQIEYLNAGKGKLYNEWLAEEKEKENDALRNILFSKLGREAYSREFNEPIENLQTGNFQIPASVFSGFYDDD